MAAKRLREYSGEKARVSISQLRDGSFRVISTNGDTYGLADFNPDESDTAWACYHNTVKTAGNPLDQSREHTTPPDGS